MNENLNLVEILKDCPKGTKLYSTVFGEVELSEVSDNNVCIERLGRIFQLTSDGRMYFCSEGECTLFPSKEQRDWSKFKVKKPKFDPKTLNPFDRVLARICEGEGYYWFADFVAMPAMKYDRVPCIMSDKDCNKVIPYNDDTKHLVGTTEEAPEYYRYWED